MKHKLNTRSGLTLTEVTIALCLVTVILSGMWVAVGHVRETARIQEGVTLFETIRQNMFDLRAGRRVPTPGASEDVAYNNVCCPGLVESMITWNVIPKAYLNPASPTTSAITPWGGGFGAYKMGSNVFRLSFYGIPTKRACIALITSAIACDPKVRGCTHHVTTRAGWNNYDPNGTTGWGGYKMKDISNWCATNDYPTGTNSVEFDYKL